MAAVAVLSGLLYLHHKIDKGGYDRCQAEYVVAQEKANAEVKTKKRKIKHEVQSMDRDRIVSELCKRQWVRGNTGCPK